MPDRRQRSPGLIFDHDPGTGQIRHHSVAVFLVFDRVILVTKRLNSWTFPETHILRGETPDQAARREVQQDLGLTVPILPFAFEETVIMPEVCVHGVRCHYYRVYRGVLAGLTQREPPPLRSQQAQWARDRDLLTSLDNPWRRWLRKLHGEGRWRE